ncbi:MAG TPA: hypothetical protein VFF30_01660 [Nitrososphaerales archaeon]|nr:hypothetical protein [Nitrososphaerales archaeon]
MVATKGKITRLVKVTYGSKKVGGTSLGKRLFGYKGWSVKYKGKRYPHKPISGNLQNLGVERVGRAKFIAREENLREIESAIRKKGGMVRQVEPVTMDEKEVERNARLVYRGFIDPLIEKIKYASETQNKELYTAALENGIRMTVSFEKFLNEMDDYGSPFVKEEKQRDSELVKKMKGLESVAQEDFEVAKIHAEFFRAELENLRDQILK